jgi:hypothetical protein
MGTVVGTKRQVLFCSDNGAAVKAMTSIVGLAAGWRSDARDNNGSLLGAASFASNVSLDSPTETTFKDIVEHDRAGR